MIKELLFLEIYESLYKSSSFKMQKIEVTLPVKSPYLYGDVER